MFTPADCYVGISVCRNRVSPVTRHVSFSMIASPNRRSMSSSCRRGLDMKVRRHASAQSLGVLGLVLVMFDDLFQVHSLNSRLNHSHRRRSMASAPRGAFKRFVDLVWRRVGPTRSRGIPTAR